MRQEKSTTMWRLGGLAITLTLLATIETISAWNGSLDVYWQY